MEKSCSVKDCNNKYSDIGYCGYHARNFRKTGDPLVTAVRLDRQIILDSQVKECTQCKEIKPFDDFTIVRRNTSGRSARCRLCQKDQRKSWNVDREGYTLKRKLSKYNLTLEEYNSMLDMQDGLCAICKTAQLVTASPNSRSLHIDHDHECCPGAKSCGKCVRGLLCGGCNLGLGHFPTPSFLLEAYDYLNGI